MCTGIVEDSGILRDDHVALIDKTGSYVNREGDHGDTEASVKALVERGMI